jgi:hypothetical protein
VGFRPGVDTLEKMEISFTCQESNDSSMDVQFVASHSTNRAAVVQLSKDILNCRPAYSTVTVLTEVSECVNCEASGCVLCRL